MKKANVWRCIETGIGSAGWNMAVDEALLESYKGGDLPILRLYRWEHSLSFGKFSDIEKSVDIKRVEDHRFPCVRRLSGGGVLVHGGDISYALILPRDSLPGKGVKESYRHLCRFLIRLYEKLGYESCFAAELGREEKRSAICLAGHEAYDIMIKGEKMGGNAQRHTRHLLLQHGTVPMEIDVPLFKPLFLEEAGLERAVTLERLGISVSYEELFGLVREAFCETFGASLISEPLSISEEQQALELLASKYSRERWNIYGETIRT